MVIPDACKKSPVNRFVPMIFDDSVSMSTADVIAFSTSSQCHSESSVASRLPQVNLPNFVNSFTSCDVDLVLDPESLRNMFSSLEKADLIELLIQSVVQSTEVRSAVGFTLSSMSTFRRLLVRNISFQYTSEDVKRVLSRYGIIEEGSVVYDRSSGKSKGFAFVTFAIVESACKAILDSNLGMIQLSGRSVLLKFAADRNDAINNIIPHVEGSKANGRRRLYLSGLSPETTTEGLSLAMSAYGALEECFVVTGPNGMSRRFAFVTFASAESSTFCLSQQPTFIDGALVSVRPATKAFNKQAYPCEVTLPDLSELNQLFVSFMKSNSLEGSL